MHISSMYKQLGLKDPADFKKEVENSVLFCSDTNLQVEVLLNGRKTGKTTRTILLSLSNLFKQKNTVIVCYDNKDIDRHNRILFDYAKIILPDLIKENKKLSIISYGKITYKNNFIIFAVKKDNTPYYNEVPLISISEKTIFIDDTL